MSIDKNFDFDYTLLLDDRTIEDFIKSGSDPCTEHYFITKCNHNGTYSCCTRCGTLKNEIDN